MICEYKLLKSLIFTFYLINFYILLIHDNLIENILNFSAILISLIILFSKNQVLLHYAHVSFVSLLILMTIASTSKSNLIFYNIVILVVLATRVQFNKCLLKSLHNKLPKSYNNIFRYTKKKIMNTDLLCILLSLVITLKILYLYLL